MKTFRLRQLAAVLVAILCIADLASAQRRGGGGRGGGGFRGGGGGGGGFRGGARMSVSRPSGGFNRAAISGGSINRGTINRGTINRGYVSNRRPVNVNDIDVDVNDRYRGYGCCYHPVARGFAAGAVTAAAIGSTVYSLPSSCSTVIVGDVTYQQCGNTWYRPRFSGTTTTYVVTSPP